MTETLEQRMDRLEKTIASLVRSSARPPLFYAPDHAPGQTPLPNHAELTTDPNDPRLSHGTDEQPVDQAAVYLVLSLAERSKGFVRPVRTRYTHVTCGGVTLMGPALAETYARDPKFYASTFCATCRMHKAVSEFRWEPDGEVVGS